MTEFANRYFEVSIDEDALLVRVTRTPVGYETLAEIGETFADLEQMMERLGRGRYRILVDLRKGPIRTDPEFEKEMSKHRHKLYRGFRAAALMVKSAVGVVQTKRHIREDQLAVAVFQDESQALAYLLRGRT